MRTPLFTRRPPRGASHVRQATHLLTYCNDRADSLVPWHSGYAEIPISFPIRCKSV